MENWQGIKDSWVKANEEYENEIDDLDDIEDISSLVGDYQKIFHSLENLVVKFTDKNE